MRSYLFVPADSQRKLEKSLGSGADGLIFDLEDAVAPESKENAREVLAAFLPRIGHTDKKIFIRINDLESGHALADLQALVKYQPDGWVLPKCRNGDDIRVLAGYLDALEYGDKAGQIIAIATETAGSIFGLGSYAGASTRLVALMWGAEDLSAAIGARAYEVSGQLTDAFSLARSLCLFAAAHAGVQAIDAVMPDIHALDTLREQALAASRDGFAGKAAIHPAQLATINLAFTATAQELEWAHQVVAAFASGAGVTRINGKMLDRPHLQLAKRLLQQASAVPSVMEVPRHD